MGANNGEQDYNTGVWVAALWPVAFLLNRF